VHHINPQSVTLDAEEIYTVERITMARWMGHGDPAKWDALSYVEQCEIKEVARALQEIERYESAKTRAAARRGNRK